ncbi:MAG: cache domain-containing protein, partial [Nodosilinea sp.]
MVIPFVVQMTAAVGLTAWLSIRNGQQAVDAAVGHLWAETTAHTNAEVDELLATARAVNTLSVKAIRRRNLDLANIRSVQDLYWDYLNTFPGILGLGAGNSSGDILGMFRRLEKGQTLYFLEYSSPETEGRYLSQRLSQQGRVIQSHMTDQHINVRERPWYQAAVEAAGPVWTDVYTSVSQVEGHVLAINTSQPVYASDGQLQGVVSVILDLGQISQILTANQPSPNGQVYIVEANGTLIGSSDGLNPVSVRDNRASRLAATESQTPLIRESAIYLNSLFQGNFRPIHQSLELDFTLKGDRHYLQITPIHAADQLSWYVVVVAPESDFMALINANTHQTIWLCLGALALAVGFSIVAARWITRPLQQLNQAAKDIAQRSLESSPLPAVMVKGGSREVKELSQSFQHMTQ